MSWRNFDNAVYNAREAVDRFTARNITLPDTITTAVAALDKISAAIPAKPPTDALRLLILDGASTDEVNAALLADLGNGRLATEYRQAETLGAQRVLVAFRNEHDTLFPQLREQADEKIAHIGKVAAVPEGVTLDQLVRDRRVADAQRLAEVDTVAAELNELYELRYVLVSRGYLAMVPEDGTDCTKWRDPRPVDRTARGNDSRAEYFIRGLRNGGELWYPTAAEAREAAQPIASERQQEAERLAAIRREQNANAGAFA